MVSSRAERVTDIAFILDDGTGRIDCNRWYLILYSGFECFTDLHFAHYTSTCFNVLETQC